VFPPGPQEQLYERPKGNPVTRSQEGLLRYTEKKVPRISALILGNFLKEEKWAQKGRIRRGGEFVGDQEKRPWQEGNNTVGGNEDVLRESGGCVKPGVNRGIAGEEKSYFTVGDTMRVREKWGMAGNSSRNRRGRGKSEAVGELPG